MSFIDKFYHEYKNEMRQLRDFIDLDQTFRNVNGSKKKTLTILKIANFIKALKMM